MTGREPKPRVAEAVGFETPYEFLDGFTDPREPFEGLYAHLATQLDLGHEAGVRGYARDLSLDVREQDAYGHLLQRMLEQNSPAFQAPVELKPLIDAGITYLKYRLSLGLLEPAVDHALRNTVPEHTRVQANRVVVAAEMVRVFVNDTFAPNGPKPPSFLDREVERHVKIHFGRKYRGGDDAITARYLTSDSLLTHVDKESDAWRLFDLRDLSTKLNYPIQDENGIRLPTTDELIEIRQSERSMGLGSFSRNGHQNGSSANGNSAHRGGRYDAAIRRTMAEVFQGTGVLTDPDGTLPEVSYADNLLGGARLDEAGVTRTTARILLNRLNRPGHKVIRLEPEPDGKTKRIPVSEEVNRLVRRRLREIVERSSGEFVLIDDFLGECEADYIRRYGEPPTSRFYEFEEGSYSEDHDRE